MTKMTAEKKENNQFDFNIPKVGEIVQGKVIAKGNASVFLDLGILGTGIIYGKEFYEARNKLRDLKKGDVVLAKVVDLENEDGYIELSLSKAKKELAWQELSQKKEKNETLEVKILGANKGGLITEILGISAFLPVSQLSSEHYPRVEGGDAQKILRHLQKFVGKKLKVKILDFNPREEKLILSEKAKEMKKIEEALKKYKIGEVVEVEVTGIVDFGVFVKLIEDKNKKSDIGTELEGLIHISELSWQLIDNPSEVVKIGQKLKVKIIDISDGKISFSLKALQEDPWENIEKRYKKEDIIEGKVKKLNPFGAFIEIKNYSSKAGSQSENEVQGLCHISEFGSLKKMEEKLKPGSKYKFKISLIDPLKRKINLKLVEEPTENQAIKEEKKKEKEE